MPLQDTTNEALVRCKYIADNGTTYVVRLKQYRVTAGGFETGSLAGLGYLPGNIKMREASLKLSDNRRERCPVASTALPLWTDAGHTSTIDGISYTKVGRSAEKTKFA